MIEDLSIGKAVAFAITTEELGEGIYSRLANQFRETAELYELFTILAKDERRHRGRFATLLDSLPKEHEGPIQYEQGQYLRAMSISEIFSSGQGIGKNAEAIRTGEDALQRALDLEKSTLLYYDAMRDILGENEILDAVIREEKSHVVRLMKVIITGAKMRGLGDDF